MAPASVRLARLQARRRLTAWRWSGDVDDAVLVASELLANAVRHGRVAGHHAWLRLAVAEGAGLVVDVSDPVPVFPGFERRVGAAADGGGESGRGLIVVRGLAEELGWFPRADGGKTVRARLAEAGGSAPASASCRALREVVAENR
ncbi:ATP-binding protein [Streptomyces sp. NPDC003006]